MTAAMSAEPDSVPIMAATKRPDTLMSLILDVLGRLQYKRAGLLFILYILFCVDTFDEFVTGRFSGACVDGGISGYGVIIKGSLLTLAYLFIDALIVLNII